MNTRRQSSVLTEDAMSKGPPTLSLKPQDVCVALQYVLKPKTNFRDLARDVGISVGFAHNANKRLQTARLLMPDGPVNKKALLEFLIYGVPYSFPPVINQEIRGIPTAHSGPVLREHFDSVEQVVWPSIKGHSRGLSLKPLCDGATSMPETNPRLYEWLTVVDALRIGRARERQMARDYLERELLGRSTE